MHIDYMYPDFPTAQLGWAVVRSKINGGQVDAKELTKAAFVVQGFAFSMYPGEPGGGGLSATAPSSGTLSEQDAIGHLDNALARGAKEERAITIPWDLVLPILLQLLQKWISK